jgi:hypothetical protein
MLETISTSVTKLKPNPRYAYTHSKKQLRRIADSIRQSGLDFIARSRCATAISRVIPYEK